jgi:hypothetical protein
VDAVDDGHYWPECGALELRGGEPALPAADAEPSGREPVPLAALLEDARE